MPTASRNVRKLRRIKRERSLAFKYANMAAKQAAFWKNTAGLLERELSLERELKTPPDNKVSITVLPDETPEVGDDVGTSEDPKPCEIE